MTEREALESTYFDSADVYRTEQVKDEQTKQTRQAEVLAASNISCALSGNSGAHLSLADGSGSAEVSFTLFCAPDAPIHLGNRLKVTTSSGVVYSLRAGLPIVYADSHSEIPLSGQVRA